MSHLSVRGPGVFSGLVSASLQHLCLIVRSTLRRSGVKDLPSDHYQQLTALPLIFTWGEYYFVFSLETETENYPDCVRARGSVRLGTLAKSLANSCSGVKCISIMYTMDEI